MADGAPSRLARDVSGDRRPATAVATRTERTRVIDLARNRKTAAAWFALAVVVAGGIWLQCSGRGEWLSLLLMVASAATATIIYVQAELLRDQNNQGRLQDQATLLIELENTWRSNYFLALRSRWAKNQQKGEEDLEGLDLVVEFLEEFGVLRSLNLLDDNLIWDSPIGWHAARYYFYSLSDIEKLRERWGGDPTLFGKLKSLWTGYLQVEQHERNLSPGQIEEELRETKDHFLKAEEMLSWLIRGEKY